MCYGPEFTGTVVRDRLERSWVRTLFIEPGSPWKNGYNESFNGKLKGELIHCEIFYSLQEAYVLVEQYRREYNTIRPHSSLWATARLLRKRSGPLELGSHGLHFWGPDRSGGLRPD